MSEQVTLEIPDDILQRAKETAEHTGRPLEAVLSEWLAWGAHESETEAEWESRVMAEALGDALLPDGSIDFARLHERGIIVDLSELDPEGQFDEEE
jgi:hypothetical protein